MRKIDFCKISFAAACLSLFLPWFSHSPKMTGYLWGLHYIHYFLLPMIFIAVFAFSRENRLPTKIAAAVSAFANIPLLLLAWGRFNIAGNVSGKWAFDTRVLHFGFYIALVLFFLLLVSVLIKVFKSEKSGVISD